MSIVRQVDKSSTFTVDFMFFTERFFVQTEKIYLRRIRQHGRNKTNIGYWTRIYAVSNQSKRG